MTDVPLAEAPIRVRLRCPCASAGGSCRWRRGCDAGYPWPARLSVSNRPNVATFRIEYVCGVTSQSRSGRRADSFPRAARRTPALSAEIDVPVFDALRARVVVAFAKSHEPVVAEREVEKAQLL